MFNHVLVVCTGNICRSPVAEAMLKRQFPSKVFESAGLGALVGEGVDDNMRRLAAEEGIQLGQHSARQLNTDMLDQAQLILVMSERQRLSLVDLYPTATGKIMLFGHWLEQSDETADIPDPYRKSYEFFRLVYLKLRAATDSWNGRL